MPFPYSTTGVNSGTDATATDENNIRKDGRVRWLKFEVLGTLVIANTQGGSFLMPFAGSIGKITSITDSGGATISIINGTGPTTVKSGHSASSTANEDTTITNPNFAKNDIITLNITGISSGVHLVVMVEVLATP